MFKESIYHRLVRLVLSEGLSGASRAYRKVTRKHQRKINQALDAPTQDLHNKHLASAERADKKSAKIKKHIPRSPKREVERSEKYWNKFGRA